MREILFRGKDDGTLNKQWQYGSLDIKDKEAPKIIRYDTRFSRPIAMYIPVLPKTIGQYTGINIGNEKLFEGDIVECHEDYDDSWGYTKTSIVRAVVIWDEENSCWAFKIENKYRQPFNDWTWDNSFIKGNIHDNPELLKEGV